MAAITGQRAASKRYQNRNLIEVCVQKEKGSLGISIGGGIDSGVPEKTQIFITEIKPEGPAAAQVCGFSEVLRNCGASLTLSPSLSPQGMLQKGDIIVDIDGVKLDGVTLAEATAILQKVW